MLTARIQAAEAVANATPTSIAGKALSSMSNDEVAAVEEDLQRTLQKDTNKAVKMSVLQVSPDAVVSITVIVVYMFVASYT